MLNQRVRASFNRAADTYEEAASTQREILRRLDAYLPEAPTPASARIVDAGCGTGAALPLLRERWPAAQIYPVDFAEKMLPAARSEAWPLCADAAQLPIADSSMDIYWSSLAWQWCPLNAVLAEARRVLKPGGTLAVATLTCGTFKELRKAFDGIDDKAHTLALLDPPTIEAALAAAGFNDCRVKRETIVEYHAEFAGLLRHVKRVGAREVSGERRRGLLGKGAFAEASRNYEAARCTAGLPLSYDVLYLLARA